MTGINNKEEKGFTIIELVVVLALFVLLIDASVGIFVSIVRHQRRTLQEQEFLNQASYLSEYVSKSLRTALKDEAGNCIGQNRSYLMTHLDASSGFYQGIKFFAEDGACQEIFLDADGFLKEIKL